ncbi:MAG TPA: hypothetical protein VF181_02155 [Balneolaceae bacterium]
MELVDSKKLKELISDFPISHSKHAILNAFIHLNKAKEIVDIDYKMAYFRTLTAMEEISSGLILGLTMKGYKKVSDMNYRQHYQKFLFFNYFLFSFTHFLRTVSALNPKFHIENSGKNKSPKLYLHLFDNESKQVYTPTPPFNSYLGKRNKPSDLNLNFKNTYGENVIDELISASKNLCAQRNNLLYASQKGISNYEIDFDKYLDEIRENLILLTCVWVTVIQFDEQFFIHQVLDSFKKIMNKIKDDDSIDKLIEENFISEGEFRTINIKLP